MKIKELLEVSSEKLDKFHKDIDKLIHDTFGEGPHEVDEAYPQPAAPEGQLKGKEPMPKAKAGRTDHPHGGRLVGETTSAGAVAAVAGPVGGMQKRNNTGKNALDSDEPLLGEKSTKAKKKKR